MTAIARPLVPTTAAPESPIQHSSTNAEPFEPPRMDAEEVALLNALVGVRRQFGVRIGKQAFEVTFFEQSQTPVAQRWWKVAAGDAPIWVALDNVAAIGEFDSLLAGAPWDELPEDVSLVVIHAVFEQLVARLSENLKLPLEIVGAATQESAEQADSGIGFELTTKDGRSTRGSLRFGKELCQPLTKLAESVPPVDRSSCAVVPTTVCVEVGHSIMPLEQLAALEPSDVILLDYTEFAEQQRVFVRCGPDLGFRGVIRGGEVVLEETVIPESEDSVLPAGTVDDAPVELRFELARIPLPLEAWKTLESGAKLSLEGWTTDAVRVVADGQLVADGELVRVGNRLGLRLQQLFGSA